MLLLFHLALASNDILLNSNLVLLLFLLLHLQVFIGFLQLFYQVTHSHFLDSFKSTFNAL